jgi:cysteine synthase A
LGRIHDDVGSTIGGTPLVHLARIEASLAGETGKGARLLGKLESRNPGGSVKDRIARAMIDDGERRGILAKGATLVEPTSGNTGIALAMLAAARGYKLVLTMPESMSPERVSLLRAYGAEVVLTPGTLMAEAVARAQRLVKDRPGAVMLQQFENPANPRAHFETTGPEIWDDTDGEVDALVAGVGTGGTITGAGEFLRSKRPEVLLCAVEPRSAAVLSGGRPGPHYIQGIGAGFVPKVLRRDLLDEIFTVGEDEAFDWARRLAQDEGILVGISSGAAMAAAVKLAQRETMAGRTIVVILCDGGERYVTTPLFGEISRGTPAPGPRKSR